MSAVYTPRVGDRVRVKSTVITRKYGIRVHVPHWGNKHDDHAWPGEVGTVVEFKGGPAGDQWTGHRIEFDRGRTFLLSTTPDDRPEFYSAGDGESFIRDRGNHGS